MRHRLSCILAFVLLLCAPVSLLARSSKHSSSGHPSRHHSKSSAGKTEHVSGYRTKSGKYVAPYHRHQAHTAPHHTSSGSHNHYSSHSAGTYHATPYKKDHLASAYTYHFSVQRDTHGKIKRSEAAKDAFKHQHPCPANGRSSGSCPGYVIDHVRPLECGGADAPSNMQWQ